MRIMALNAIHMPFHHRMMLRHSKFRLRLQMTLKTDRVAQRRRQPRRIDDGGAHCRGPLATGSQRDVIAVIAVWN